MSLLLGPLGGKRSFNPRQELFSNNEQGLWLDPSQISTLYQDSNGVTPCSRAGVTAKIACIWLIHETMHFLGYRASPPADKFHHSRIAREIYHAAGGGPEFGPHFLNWLRSRYWRA